jgi:hypothetical protein
MWVSSFILLIFILCSIRSFGDDDDDAEMTELETPIHKR